MSASKILTNGGFLQTNEMQKLLYRFRFCKLAGDLNTNCNETT